MFNIDWTEFSRALNDVPSGVYDDLLIIDEPHPLAIRPGKTADSDLKKSSSDESDDDTGVDHDSLFALPKLVLDDGSSSSEDTVQSSSWFQSYSAHYTSSPSKPKKQVSFSTVEVREYKITIGDHPVCKDGIALSLDWHYNTNSVVRQVSLANPLLETYFFLDRPTNRQPKRLTLDQKLRRLNRVTGMPEKQMMNIRNRSKWERRQRREEAQCIEQELEIEESATT